jgi:hypothetical protein
MSDRQLLRARRDLPAGYIRGWSFDINQRREALYLSIWGILLLLASWFGFLALARVFKPGAFPKGFLFKSGSLVETLIFIGELLLVTALMVILHEGLHGLAFWLFSHGKPQYALKVYYASAAAPDWFFPRWQYLITALAPFVGITALCIAGLAWLPTPLALPCLLMLVFNTSGAVGDLWVVGRLLISPASTYIKDYGDRIEFYKIKGLFN